MIHSPNNAKRVINISFNIPASALVIQGHREGGLLAAIYLLGKKLETSLWTAFSDCQLIQWVGTTGSLLQELNVTYFMILRPQISAVNSGFQFTWHILYQSTMKESENLSKIHLELLSRSLQQGPYKRYTYYMNEENITHIYDWIATHSFSGTRAEKIISWLPFCLRTLLWRSTTKTHRKQKSSVDSGCS